MQKPYNPALYRQIAICSVLHLMVDGLCLCGLYLLTPALPVSRIVGVFLTYNMLAFLSQPFTGMWADRLRRPHWMLLSSVVLFTLTAVVALFTPVVNPAVGTLLVAVLLGTGNSLFHVWGGKQVAVATGNDIRALGTFVATGAFGLALGYVFFSWTLFCLLLLSVCLLSVVYIGTDAEPAGETPHPSMPKKRFTLSVVCLFLFVLMVAVMLRSFAGEAFTDGVERNGTMVLLIGGVSMLGKMAGGWMARRLGIVGMLVGVLFLAFVCYLCRGYGMAVLLAGLFLVNSTMPVTLYLANLLLPNREGLAFGLLAAALIPGYLLATL